MKLFTPGKIIGLLVVFALAGGGWWYQQKAKVERAKPQFRTQAVDRGTIAQRITANGTLNPVTVVNVGTQISGTVTKLYADYNSSVKAGQVLAELDPALLKAQIEQSLATQRSAVATWTLAKSTLERNQSLRDKGFISDAALDTARKDVDAAYAQIAALRAQIQRDRTNLAYSVIRSPIKGIVVDRTVDVGQTVAASFQTPTLFKIAKDLHAMQIDTSVSEADIGNIKPGMPVLFSVDAFRDRDFTGKVRVIRLNPTVQQNVVTYNVVIDVKNDTGILLPGMTAQVNIVTQRRDNVLRIPKAALRFKPSDEALALTGGAAAKAASPPPQADGAPTRPANASGAVASGAVGSGDSKGRASPAPPKLQPAAGPSRAIRIYKLNESGDLEPVDVRTGIADTRFTEVIGDSVKEGDSIVVREISSDKASPGSQQPGGIFRMRLFG